MLRIGCCLPGGAVAPQGAPLSPLQSLQRGQEAVLEAGYDYAEAGVALLMQLSGEELSQAAWLHTHGRLRIETCNGFIPSTLPIMTEAVSAELEAYVREALRRMTLVGVDTVVFGSGRARAIPDGWTPKQAQQALDRFLYTASALALPHGMTLVIEPLNRAETNCICSVAEGAAAVRRVNRPNVRLLADAYHMYAEQDPLSSLVSCAELLTHIHIAEPPERVYPGRSGGAYLRAFGAMLRGTPYSGRVTAECSFRNFASEAPIAAQFMREIF